jgi:hypothetical protein
MQRFNQLCRWHNCNPRYIYRFRILNCKYRTRSFTQNALKAAGRCASADPIFFCKLARAEIRRNSDSCTDRSSAHSFEPIAWLHDDGPVRACRPQIVRRTMTTESSRQMPVDLMAVAAGSAPNRSDWGICDTAMGVSASV